MDIVISGGEKNPDWIPVDLSLVCSEHFIPDDYKSTCKRKVLLPKAVPSIFPKDPSAPKPSTITEPVVACNLVVNHNYTCLISEPSHDTHLVSPQQEKVVCQAQPEHYPVSCDFTSSFLSDHSDYCKIPDLETSKTVGCQVDFLSAKLLHLKKELKRQRNQVTYLKNVNRKLRMKLKTCQDDMETKHHPHCDSLFSLEVSAANGDNLAVMIMEQIKASNKKWKCWSDKMIQNCWMWRQESSKGYEYARKAKLLNLPSRETLKRYLNKISDTEKPSVSPSSEGLNSPGEQLPFIPHFDS